MTMLDAFWLVATAYAVVWSAYVLLPPVLGALRGSRVAPPRSDRGSTPTLAIIVPAHDMERFIGRCIEALNASGYPRDRFEIYVVADHCADATAERALEAGASVLQRNEGPAGKTYTLAWTIEKLAERGISPDVYVITDATARVEPGFLSALVSHWQGGEDIIVSHPIVDAENQQWFAQCLGLTLAHRNIQNRSRQRLGLSALIEGRGMAYSQRYIQEHGWSLAVPRGSSKDLHPTEDWRHGVQAVERGYRIAFADDARVRTPLRDTLGAATKQGIRWERGRMANAYTNAIRLLLSGLRKRSRLQIFAALDAIQPPVAVLSGICIGVALWSIVAAESARTVMIGTLPFILAGLYGAAVIAEGHRDGIRAKTLLWAPIYIGWRCVAFVLAWGLPGKRA